jgi:hypothetical protein
MAMGRVHRGVLIAISALSSVASAESSGPPPGQKLRGTVLLWQDAKVFSEPKADAPSVALEGFGGGAREDHVGAAVAMRVVADRGEFLEVTPADANCGRGRLVARGARALHLFVQRGDLAPVLAARFSASYPNGTSVTLAAGTPVVPASTHYSRVGVDDFSIALPIPAAKIKYSYPSFADQPVATSARTLYAVAPETTVKLGEGLVVLASRAGLAATKVDRRHETALVEVQASCTRLTFIAPSDRVTIEERRPPRLGATMGRFGSLRLQKERYYVRKGTSLANEAGRVIAVADAETEVAKPSGKWACFEAPLRLEAPGTHQAPMADAATAPSLRLCALATTLKRAVGDGTP